MTTNEMIYKTITTKMSKEPKFKAVLEDMGFEILDTNWSDYDYWGIKCRDTGVMIVLSRGYDNKRRLYKNGTHAVKTKEIKKIDFANMLREGRERWYVRSSIPASEYSRLRDSIRDSKRRIALRENDIVDLERQIKQLNDRLEEKRTALDANQKALCDARSRVSELRSKHREETV